MPRLLPLRRYQSWPPSASTSHIFGDSLEKVASRKRGIIKPGTMAVLAGQEPAAARVLLARAVEVGAVVKAEGRISGCWTPIRGGRAGHPDPV